MTFLDLAADLGLSKTRSKRLAFRRIERLRRAPYANLEPEEVEILKAAYQSEINRARHEAGLPAPDDGADGMTIRQIAALCEVSESTIRNWITSAKTADVSAKTAGAQESKIAARFTLPETLAIIRAGGNTTLADLLEANARAPMAPLEIVAPPSPAPVKVTAALLHEGRLAVKDKALTSDDLRILLGLPLTVIELAREEEKAPLTVAEEAFGQLRLLAEDGPAQGR